jgi:hypothetical protein
MPGMQVVVFDMTEDGKGEIEPEANSGHGKEYSPALNISPKMQAVMTAASVLFLVAIVWMLYGMYQEQLEISELMRTCDVNAILQHYRQAAPIDMGDKAVVDAEIAKHINQSAPQLIG